MFYKLKGKLGNSSTLGYIKHQDVMHNGRIIYKRTTLPYVKYFDIEDIELLFPTHIWKCKFKLTAYMSYWKNNVL